MSTVSVLTQRPRADRTGNKGYIYRIVPTRFIPPAQFRAYASHALLPGPNGKIYAATGNVGKFTNRTWLRARRLHRIRCFRRRPVFRSGVGSTFKGAANGGRIAIEARSGNLDRPQKNWSAWSGAISTEEGARLNSPAARFVQWKPRFPRTRPTNRAARRSWMPSKSPISPQRRAARAGDRSHPAELQIPHAQHRHQHTANPEPAPLEKRSHSSMPLNLESTTPAMQYAKGAIGARWVAAETTATP